MWGAVPLHMEIKDNLDLLLGFQYSLALIIMIRENFCRRAEGHRKLLQDIETYVVQYYYCTLNAPPTGVFGPKTFQLYPKLGYSVNSPLAHISCQSNVSGPNV